MTLVMGAGSALTGLIWGIPNYVIRRKKHKEKVYKSESEFDRYLEGLRDMLLTYREDNIGYMFERYPRGDELLTGDDATRFLKDEDYLFLRLGLGKSPFSLLRINEANLNLSSVISAISLTLRKSSSICRSCSSRISSAFYALPKLPFPVLPRSTILVANV